MKRIALVLFLVFAVCLPLNPALATTPVTITLGPESSFGPTAAVFEDGIVLEFSGAGVPAAQAGFTWIDSKFKMHKLVLNSKKFSQFNASETREFNGKFFFRYIAPTKNEAFVSVNQKTILKSYTFPGTKLGDSRCMPSTVLGSKLYVSCDNKKVYTINKDDVVESLNLPYSGETEIQYIGSNQILIRVGGGENEAFVHFYALNELGEIFTQFKLLKTLSPGLIDPYTVGKLNEGWVVYYRGVEDAALNLHSDKCGNEFYRGAIYVLNRLGELVPLEANPGPNDGDDFWEENGVFFVNRLKVNANLTPSELLKFSIDKSGALAEISRSTKPKIDCSARGVDFRVGNIFLPEGMNGGGQAANKICKALTKGKGVDWGIMFKGYAVCRPTKTKLVAYPYPNWTPQPLAQVLLPLIAQR